MRSKLTVIVVVVADIIEKERNPWIQQHDKSPSEFLATVIVVVVTDVI